MSSTSIITKTIAVSSIACTLFSCKPEPVVPAPTKGSIDVSTYVALGNSLTAGYADNALYREGQLYSYPNLIAKQLKLVGGGDFKQPWVSSSSVGIGSDLNSRLVLAPVQDCSGAKLLSTVPLASQGDMSIFTTSVANQGPFNNMGVPGAKTITIIYPGYGDPSKGPGNYNPFFTRMTADPAHASMLSDAASQNPTFFSLTIGNNDVLSYAFAGGASDFITPSDGPPGFGFNASVDLIVNTLTANGAKGVVANIPDITAMPYFTTIPYNGLLLDQTSAAGLTAAYAQLGITFQAGSNPFIIEDDNAPGGVRKIKEGEFILLTTPLDSLKCGGWGSLKPIPNRFVLTADKVSSISNAISNFNSKLKAVADAKGLAFVDVNAFMSSLKSGIVYNGIQMSTVYAAGGAFSLDGIHLTPLGNALLANEYLKAINRKYGATIPLIDATNIRGTVYP
jgi:hypothetical protein